MPFEYLELKLCRDIYHCKPSDLDEIGTLTVMRHLACVEIEDRVKRANRR